MQDLTTLLRRLTEEGLEFVIVGGFAAVTHGSAYVTRDVDICAVLTAENIEKLRNALAHWNPKHRMTPQRLSFLNHPPRGSAGQQSLHRNGCGRCGGSVFNLGRG